MAIGRPVSLTNNVASKTISVTATENQTLFTVTGGYRINQIAVFRNGARLVDGQDFTARDGATVTLFKVQTLMTLLNFKSLMILELLMQLFQQKHHKQFKVI